MGDTTTPSKNWQKAGLQILFFFRFIQLGSVTIAGFVYCYLVWHHNNHYCAFYPHRCTPQELSQINVPWEYKVTIAACTLAFLESYISTASFLHRQVMPNYRTLLCATLPVTTFMGFALVAILRNTAFCWFLQIPESVRSNVKEKNCVIVVDGYVSLSIATGFTCFIFLMSAIVVIDTYTKREKTKKERVTLPLEIEEKDGLLGAAELL